MARVRNVKTVQTEEKAHKARKENTAGVLVRSKTKSLQDQKKRTKKQSTLKKDESKAFSVKKLLVTTTDGMNHETVRIQSNIVGKKTTITEKRQETNKQPGQTQLETNEIEDKKTTLTGKTIIQPPIPSLVLIQKTAHYVGAFFLAIGTAFTGYAAFGLNTSSLMGGQTAQTIDSSTSLSVTSTSDGATSANTVTLDPKPDVRISLNQSGTLSDQVQVGVTVPYARSVALLLVDVNHGSMLTLGYANRVDDSTWKYTWDTRRYPNGDYKIKAVIVNEFGDYSYTTPDAFSTQNTAGTSASDTGSVTQLSTSTTSPSSVSTLVRLSILEESPVGGTVQMSIDVQNSTEVKVYAKNTTTGMLYYVGLAEKKSDTEWRVTWNSITVPDGGYTIVAKAKIDSVVYESPRLSTYVQNMSTQTTVPASNTTATTSNVSTESIQNTSTTTATSRIATTTTQAPTATLEPTISLKVASAQPLKDFAEIAIKTSPVYWVEVYAQPKNSLTPYFLGLAQRVSDTDWKLNWQTKNAPNGQYMLYARVKSSFGFSEGQRVAVIVENPLVVTYTETQEAQIDSMHAATNELAKVTDGSNLDTEFSTSSEAFKKDQIVYIQPIDSLLHTLDVTDEEKSDIEQVLSDFRRKLDGKLNEFAKAIRANDEEAAVKAKKDIEKLRDDALLNLPESVEKKKTVDVINTYLSQVSFELQELTLKNETILRERIGEAVERDSDSDGITDYDELNLYKTNPYIADSDTDGYIDSAEIRLGYDPLNAASEAYVRYESPKETGLVREDLLVVHSVTTVMPDTDATNKQPKALISGKGLPNSFVTLYIFSTPIVVTVRTDADGNWNYLFDKELEDGEHEVYVGIVDNDGAVVAKSNPLPFVKTAEAFVGGDTKAPTSAPDVAAPSLIERNMLIFMLASIVTILGFLLILLGIYTRDKQKDRSSVQLSV